MKDRTRNIIQTVGFLVLVIGIMIVNICLPDTELSVSERRKLKQFPLLNADTVTSGRFFTEFEDYALDQFVLRDTFRSFKALGRFNLLMQKDNNDIYLVDGSVYKIEYPLKPNMIVGAANKYNAMADMYLEGLNLYYTIVPDKNMFVAEKNGYPSLDYALIEKLMAENVKDMTYIGIYDKLTLDDYYRTDIHWAQENLFGVANHLLSSMGAEGNLKKEDFTAHTLSPFYGSYYGQSALAVKPDLLTYLTNDILDGCTLHDYQTGKDSPLYATELFGGMDSYDVFLSGAKALLSVTNPAVNNGKSLVVFRDSFGSSLVPLLAMEYEKVTLVDMRYIFPNMIGEYIDFSEYTDALFMYNSIVLNNSAMLR